MYLVGHLLGARSFVDPSMDSIYIFHIYQFEGINNIFEALSFIL
jgi:hypothetical protein